MSKLWMSLRAPVRFLILAGAAYVVIGLIVATAMVTSYGEPKAVFTQIVVFWPLWLAYRAMLESSD